MTKLTREEVKSEIEDILCEDYRTSSHGRHAAASELAKRTGLSLYDSFEMVVEFQRGHMSVADAEIYKKFTIRLANCLCNMGLWNVADVVGSYFFDFSHGLGFFSMHITQWRPPISSCPAHPPHALSPLLDTYATSPPWTHSRYSCSLGSSPSSPYFSTSINLGLSMVLVHLPVAAGHGSRAVSSPVQNTYLAPRESFCVADIRIPSRATRKLVSNPHPSRGGGGGS